MKRISLLFAALLAVIIAGYLHYKPEPKIGDPRTNHLRLALPGNMNGQIPVWNTVDSKYHPYPGTGPNPPIIPINGGVQGSCNPSVPQSPSIVIAAGSRQVASGCTGTASSNVLTCTNVADFAVGHGVSILSNTNSALSQPASVTPSNVSLAFREPHAVPTTPFQVTTNNTPILADKGVIYTDNHLNEPQGLALVPVVSPIQTQYKFLGLTAPQYQFSTVDATAGANVGISYTWQDNTGGVSATYQCGAEDSLGGLSQASAAATDSTVPTTLGWQHYVDLTCATVSNAKGYYFYKNGKWLGKGGQTCSGAAPVTCTANATFRNFSPDGTGQQFIGPPWYYPTTPPAAATNGIQTSYITAISGNTITLNDNLVSNVTSVNLYHNDTTAIQNCVNKLAGNITQSVWLGSHSYTVGDQIIDSNGNLEQATTGTSGSSTPLWNPTLNGTTTDNTVTWTNKQINPRGGLVILGPYAYNANVALAQGVSLVGSSPHFPEMTFSQYHYQSTSIYGVLPQGPSIYGGVVYGPPDPDDFTLSANMAVQNLDVVCLGGGPGDFGINYPHADFSDMTNVGASRCGEAGIRNNSGQVDTFMNIHSGLNNLNFPRTMDTGACEIGGSNHKFLGYMECSAPGSGTSPATITDINLSDNSLLVTAAQSSFDSEMLLDFGDNGLRVMKGRTGGQSCTQADCLVGPAEFNYFGGGVQTQYGPGNGINVVGDNGSNRFDGMLLTQPSYLNANVWDGIYNAVPTTANADMFNNIHITSSFVRFGINDMTLVNRLAATLQGTNYKNIKVSPQALTAYSTQSYSGGVSIGVPPTGNAVTVVGGTTIDVSQTPFIRFVNSPNPQTITQFTGGPDGYDIYLLSNDTFTTLADESVTSSTDGGIVTAMRAPLILEPGEVYHFKKYATQWFEVSIPGGPTFWPNTSASPIVMDPSNSLLNFANIVDANPHQFQVTNSMPGMRWSLDVANSSGTTIPTPLLTAGMYADSSFGNPANGKRKKCEVAELAANDYEIGPCSADLSVPTPAVTAAPPPTSTPSPTPSPTSTPGPTATPTPGG